MKKRILLAITVLIVAVIFIHSSMPGNESQTESNAFLEMFNAVMTFFHLPIIFDEGSIRKLAHFVEFAVLGFFTSATAWAYGGIKNQIFKILFTLLAVPVTDEFIQYFSPGRSSQVKDVLLDFSGAIFGLLCVAAISAALSLRKPKSKI